MCAGCTSCIGPAANVAVIVIYFKQVLEEGTEVHERLPQVLSISLATSTPQRQGVPRAIVLDDVRVVD